MSPAKVMIAEDEAITAMALEESVRKLGYEVAANVTTGEEAVMTAMNQHVDVVLMDIHLRGLLDGIQAAERIRKEVQVPCIYLTAYSDEATLRRAKVAEPYGYLLKPYHERELRAAIEIALHNSALEQDRRAAQEAVQMRDQVLQDIIDNSPAITYLKDTEGRFTLVNRRFEAVFGRTRADVRGKEGPEALPPEISALLDPEDAHVLASGGRVEMEQTIPLPDGLHHYLASRFALRRTAGGAPYGVCVVMTDVTDLERAEAALRRTETLYRAIADTSSDLITLSTQEGIVQYASPAYLRTLGMAPEEVIGRSGYDLIHPEDLPRVRDGTTLGPEDGASASIRFRARRKDGEYIWLEANIQRTVLPGPPEQRLTLSVTRDITERMRVEQSIRDMNDVLEARVADRTRQLEGMNRQLATFTEIVSHDLRAPVRGIAQLAAELREDHAARLDPEGARIVERIQAEGRHLSDLLNDLITFTRASRAELDRGTVDLSALAREVAADLRATEPSRSIEIEIADGLVADGDPLLLKLVLQNLLGNAWKFTRDAPAPRIVVDARTGPDGRRLFQVRDNGVGFDPTAADRLFQPFQRLHPREVFPGTGLGLSSVRSIIERHGGRVWAEGRPGEGATFTFTL